MSFPNPAACGHGASAGPALPGGGLPTEPAAPARRFSPLVASPALVLVWAELASASLWVGARGTPVQGLGPPQGL